MPRLVPRPPPSDATAADRLRYVRHWAIFGPLASVPGWVLVFAVVQSATAVAVFAAVIAVTVLNVASLTWRIRRAERR